MQMQQAELLSNKKVVYLMNCGYTPP